MLGEAEDRTRRLIPRVHGEAEDSTPKLTPRVHGAVGGIPYYDEELDVAQSKAHRVMISAINPVLALIADEAGLSFLSDEPIWYLHPETDAERAYHGDCVFARVADTSRITAADLLLVIEVVSTNDRRKELKDVHFQRLLNEINGVPEFALVFPDTDDARALRWFRLVDGRYEEHDVAPGGRVVSREIPDLELRVLPHDQWSSGEKIAVFFRGEHRPSLAGERARAEDERARAERLATQLRALGVEPDA